MRDNRLLSISDVCDYLNVGKQTAKIFMDSIDAERIIGNEKRYDKVVIDKYFDSYQIENEKQLETNTFPNTDIKVLITRNENHTPIEYEYSLKELCKVFWDSGATFVRDEDDKYSFAHCISRFLGIYVGW